MGKPYECLQITLCTIEIAETDGFDKANLFTPFLMS